jgi:hypothetical protein
MFKFRRYRDADIESWNRFVAESKNGTFLFDRHYMDYHRDRFPDHSVLIFDEQDDLAAVLPASRDGDAISSHGGLTYGGVISDRRMTTTRMIELFAGLRAHLKGEGAHALHYKTMPRIYHRLPADEDQYALFLGGAELKRRDVLSVLSPDDSAAPVQKRRSRGAQGAAKAGVVCEETEDFTAFWDMLAANLKERFDRSPVHTVAELALLRSRFPENIRLFVARKDGKTVGGTVMYLSGQVAHAQYIASNAAGRDLGALDLLFLTLLEKLRGFRYFDFGISTEENGTKLNKGLIDFKEGFGARAVVHDHYLVGLG